MFGIAPRRRLIILLRPIISTLILGPEIFFRRNDPFFQVFPLLTIIIASYFASIIFFLILKTGKRGTVYDFSHTVSDTVIISGLVYFTGSINSPFIVLYFLNILEAILFLRPVGSFTITSLATASFIAMSILWMNRHLVADIDSLVFNIEVVRYFLKIFIYILFFYLATAVTTYFRERFAAGTRALEAVLMSTDDILENINSGIVTIDNEGVVKQMNPAARSILNLGEVPVLGSRYSDIFPEGVKGLSNMIENFSGQDREQVRIEIVNEKGLPVPIMASISSMRTENVDLGGLIINLVDLTEEEEIQKRLRSADRMKTALELSAGIAHEIRNPLASIQGALEVIMKELKGNEGRIGKLADLVLKEAERLNNIIERFLQFVRIPKRERKNTDLSVILRDVVELVKNHPTYNKGIEISTTFPSERFIVFVDPEQIKQVFLNILLNAFAAVERDGKIEIRFPRRNTHCGVSFKDNGKGIDGEDVEKIFQPFFSKNPSGSGLGLSVAHRIIEQHKGEITVLSKTGEGSTFTVWLPLVER
jgi:two-component system sensor histidine kinase PilS (NtrC family)